MSFKNAKNIVIVVMPVQIIDIQTLKHDDKIILLSFYRHPPESARIWDNEYQIEVTVRPGIAASS